VRKYLDDIGVTDRPDTMNMDDSRLAAWEEEREIYGFDERETWSLIYTFYLWLYERLMKYKDLACVDLTYHKFDYNSKEYTQGQLIDMMLDRLRFCFSDEYNEWDSKQWEYVHEIEKIWAIVLPAMWW